MQEQVGIRVMLVDPHRIVLWALQQLIDAKRPAMQVVAAAHDPQAVPELVRNVSPDVVVLDAGLVRGEPAVDIPSLVNGGAARVLLLSGSEDAILHDKAVLQGACGVVRKDDSPEVLLKAITKVHQGQLWLDRSTTGRIFVELSRRRTDPVLEAAMKKFSSLTEREQDVVRTLVSIPGADNKRLAERLHMGETTLRNHLSRIYDKLGVPNRVELYVFAQRHAPGDREKGQGKSPDPGY